MFFAVILLDFILISMKWFYHFSPYHHSNLISVNKLSWQVFVLKVYITFVVLKIEDLSSQVSSLEKENEVLAGELSQVCTGANTQVNCLSV